MKNLLNKYILYYFRPKYKRFAEKTKACYYKFIYWRYGIKDDTNNPEGYRERQENRRKLVKEKQKKYKDASILISKEGDLLGFKNVRPLLLSHEEVEKQLDKALNDECCHGKCECTERKNN